MRIYIFGYKIQWLNYILYIKYGIYLWFKKFKIKNWNNQIHQPSCPNVFVNYSYSANWVLSTEGLVLFNAIIISILSIPPMSISSFLKSNQVAVFPSSPYLQGTCLFPTCLNFFAVWSLLTGSYTASLTKIAISLPL